MGIAVDIAEITKAHFTWIMFIHTPREEKRAMKT